MPIIIKSDDEIAIMREAGRIVAQTLQKLLAELRPGLVVKELDTIVRKEFAKHGVDADVPGLRAAGYPATRLRLGQRGDRARHPGRSACCRTATSSASTWAARTRASSRDHADHRRSSGRRSRDASELVDVTRECAAGGHRSTLRAGQPARARSRTRSRRTSRRAGFGVVREYVGHGVGRAMHEEPQVPNFGPADRGPVLKKGMVLALEPMVTVGDWRTKQLDDGWTVVTADGSLSAHFEHTIAITDGDPVVLTVP